ncbi:hypothetical protein BC629DRAFT_1295167 [Irpex lacteus]|nr:hypothetical protein BC629DRAFT_1601631 [Irpex lacteus]KAI0759952.1 hypothetical protein BC629DRAFT_1295167 [Irpex lacteus]
MHQTFTQGCSTGRAVTTDEWRVDLNGTPRSPWNYSCWRVFYFSFLQAYRQYTPAAEKDIESAFFNHLRYLQNQWKALTGQATRVPSTLALRGRAERKRTILLRRVTAAQDDQDTVQHVGMLQQLGTDGMSSDESDVENGVRIFRIKKVPWRHPRLTFWLRAFDALHRKSRYGTVDPRLRGAPPRERVDSGLISERLRVPSGLPENAYDEVFLRNLPTWMRQDLAPAPAYDFSHSDRVQQ